ncbi:MAG TPA: hypothetical protein VGK14_04405 [Novimethylophilus sp.]|jgi:hypothetical protein|uniref:hypothetical protein n=1 Tax=Novimethylophilus sp. TaxID=2137426 RepID=UPI002F3E4D8F
MSAKILGLVLEHFPGGDHVSLSIAIVLADAADPDGTNVRPSVARVAKLSRTSERTVQTHLRKFEDSGFLEKVAEGGGRGRPTEFKINLGWILKHPSLIEELALARERGKGAAVAPFPETVQIEGSKGEKTPKKGCRNPAAAAAPNPQPQTLDPEKQLQPASDSEQSSGSCLSWPKNLHPKIQKTIAAELVFLDFETQQLALDELAARLAKGDLGNPLAWFQGMLARGVTPTPAGQKIAHLRQESQKENPSPPNPAVSKASWARNMKNVRAAIGLSDAAAS